MKPALLPMPEDEPIGLRESVAAALPLFVVGMISAVLTVGLYDVVLARKAAGVEYREQELNALRSASSDLVARNETMEGWIIAKAEAEHRNHGGGDWLHCSHPYCKQARLVIGR